MTLHAVEPDTEGRPAAPAEVEVLEVRVAALEEHLEELRRANVQLSNDLKKSSAELGHAVNMRHRAERRPEGRMR